MTDRADNHDPRAAEPAPPFTGTVMEAPGDESMMDPRPDFGEESYRGSDRLTDRVAIITGGDSGIGRAVALAFAREGADVVIAHLSEHDDARETVRVVEESGRRAVAVAGDLGYEANCKALVTEAVNTFGRLDILVNNAATQGVHEGVLDIPSAEIETVFRTNILSQFWMVRAAIPHMKPGSTIINTTSIQAYQPSPTLVHYAATKGAVSTFTKALAQELIEQGIRVNAVAPGPVWTPLIAMSFDLEEQEHFGEDNPMGRPAQPAELAPTYVFLASDESRFVVGEVIGVTGGKLTPS